MDASLLPSEDLFNQTCQIIEVTAPTGNDMSYTHVEGTPGDPIPCALQVQSSTEGVVYDRQTGNVQYSLYLRGIVNVKHYWLILIDSIKYRVKGPGVNVDGRGCITTVTLELEA